MFVSKYEEYALAGARICIRVLDSALYRDPVGGRLDDCVFLSLSEMAQAVRERRCSCRELVDAHIARIEQLNPSLNAFVHTDFDRVRKQAAAADIVVGAPKTRTLGPLHGVPISMKSAIDVAGLPCECSGGKVSQMPERWEPLLMGLEPLPTRRKIVPPLRAAPHHRTGVREWDAPCETEIPHFFSHPRSPR
jgi:hypothetical protein